MTVSGPNQYMHLSGGCEIVAHTIRALLESYSSLVVGKVDCCNAFNAIHKHPILQVIADEAPALLPFTNCLLNKALAGTIYHDPHEQVIVVHKMTEGVPQGGAMSSALFNMGQSVAIRPAAAAHPQVHILLIADDTHVGGPPEAVIAAILESAMLPSVYPLPRLHPVKMSSTVLAMNILISSVRLQPQLACTGSRSRDRWLPRR